MGTFRADPEALKQFGRVVSILENLSWQEQRTKAIGAAVGRGPQAEQLVAEAQRSIDELGMLVSSPGWPARRGPLRLDVANLGVLALIPPSSGFSIVADVGLAQPAAQTGNPPRLGGVADHYALIELRHRGAADHLRPHRAAPAVVTPPGSI